MKILHHVHAVEGCFVGNLRHIIAQVLASYLLTREARQRKIDSFMHSSRRKLLNEKLSVIISLHTIDITYCFTVGICTARSRINQGEFMFQLFFVKIPERRQYKYDDEFSLLRTEK